MKYTKRKTFIFDLDDTLIWNAHDYSVALAEFYSFLIKKLKNHCPFITRLSKKQEEIDIKEVENKGFNFRRFPLSFVKTYKDICKEERIQYDRDIADECYRIGLKTFEMPMSEIVEGAKECLEFLVGKGDELILMTKGYKSVQQKKISKFGLEKYFSEIHITKTKNRHLFENITGKRDKKLVYSVGNSIRSDIMPAREVGIYAIYIPWTGGWNYEESRGAVAYQRDERFVFITFPKITDLIKNYSLL